MKNKLKENMDDLLDEFDFADDEESGYNTADQ